MGYENKRIQANKITKNQRKTLLLTTPLAFIGIGFEV